MCSHRIIVAFYLINAFLFEVYIYIIINIVFNPQLCHKYCLSRPSLIFILWIYFKQLMYRYNGACRKGGLVCFLVVIYLPKIAVQKFCGYYNVVLKGVARLRELFTQRSFCLSVGKRFLKSVYRPEVKYSP